MLSRCSVGNLGGGQARHRHVSISHGSANGHTTRADLQLDEEFRGKVDFAWGPEVMDYGMREFAVQDPNGYFIAFAEPA